MKLCFNTIQYYQCFRDFVRLLAAAYTLKIPFFMRLKWSKGHGFLRVEWWSKIQLSDQYAPAREEKQFFIISYNRKKHKWRDTRPRARD